jgi:type II secretory pathway component PulL
MSLYNIPSEILYNIFCLLRPHELAQINLCCKWLQRAVVGAPNQVWKGVFMEEFDPPLETPPDWREALVKRKQ